ncbi:hypothetical protein D3C72_2368020 [compost metagenome]
MEAFEVVCMQGGPRRSDGFLQKRQIAFVSSNQIAATRRRYLPCKPKSLANMLVHRNPAWSRGTGATTFGTILNVNPA